MKRGHGAFRGDAAGKNWDHGRYNLYSRAMPTPGAAGAAGDTPQSAAAGGAETPTDDHDCWLWYRFYSPPGDLIDKRRAVKQLQLFDFAGDRQPLNQLRGNTDRCPLTGI